MRRKRRPAGGIDPRVIAQEYAHLLDELHEVGRRMRDRLSALHDRFPDDCPAPPPEQNRGPRPGPERPPDAGGADIPLP